MVIFTKKFRTLDPHLPIVWDKVLKKNVFFLTPSLMVSSPDLSLTAVAAEAVEPQLQNKLFILLVILPNCLASYW